MGDSRYMHMLAIACAPLRTQLRARCPFWQVSFKATAPILAHMTAHNPTLSHLIKHDAQQPVLLTIAAMLSAHAVLQAPCRHTDSKSRPGNGDVSELAMYCTQHAASQHVTASTR